MRPRVLPIIAGVLAGIALTAPLASAQTPVLPPIQIEVGNWDLRRHVELVAAAADVVHAVTEAGLGKVFETASTSQDRRGRLFRLGKLYTVDLPIVALAHTVGHEFGHTSRLREEQFPSAGFRLKNWPWPVPFVDAVHRSGSGTFLNRFDPGALGIAAAGYEAGRVRDRRFADAFSGQGGIDYFSAARLVYSRLEEPLALAFYLRESELAGKDPVLQPATVRIQDPRAYAIALTAVQHNRVSEGDFRRTARRIRGGAPWALLDLQLAGSVYRLADYLWTGRVVGEALSIHVGKSRLWPRATFALTPVGIARGAELLWVHERVAVMAAAEKTEQAVALETIGLTERGFPILADRTPSLWGGHVSVWSHRRSASMRLDAHLWNQAATGRGGAVEARVERSLAATGTHLSPTLSVGYKTAGYLAGAPDAARWFGSIGMTIRP